LTLLLMVLFLAPLAAHVPLAALAAILFVAAWNNDPDKVRRPGDIGEYPREGGCYRSSTPMGDLVHW
jgi:hypothetical protein